MAIGRISGSVLKSNLTRNGTDLAFETNLLYLDVTNSRVGIGTSEPTTALQVNGTITSTALAVTDDVTLANNKKVIFGDPAENISGDGTRITIASSNSITLDATTDIILDADGEGGGGGGDIIFRDAGLEYGRIENNGGNIAIANRTSNTWYNIIEASGNNDLTMPGNVTVGGTIEAANFKQGGANFTDSLLIGHSTTGTLNNAISNTAIGSEAMDAVTSGDYNTAVGHKALTSMTDGQRNTMVGFYAGQKIDSGDHNVGMGHAALAEVVNTGRNSAFGYQAGNKATGYYGTYIGYQAGLNTAGGNYGTYLGWTAGDNVTSGVGNVIIGAGTDAISATASRQLAIGTYDGTNTTTWITGDKCRCNNI